MNYDLCRKYLLLLLHIEKSVFGRPLIFLTSSFIIFCAYQITRNPKSNNIAHYDAFDLWSILLDLYVYYGMLFIRLS